MKAATSAFTGAKGLGTQLHPGITIYSGGLKAGQYSSNIQHSSALALISSTRTTMLGSLLSIVTLGLLVVAAPVIEERQACSDVIVSRIPSVVQSSMSPIMANCTGILRAGDDRDGTYRLNCRPCAPVCSSHSSGREIVDLHRS
jgi:hypothetical protein